MEICEGEGEGEDMGASGSERGGELIRRGPVLRLVPHLKSGPPSPISLPRRGAVFAAALL